MLSEFASGHGAHAHGCQHYERHCHIKAVCCQRFYPCRRCHDQDTESGCDTVEMDRKAVQRICCQQCGLEQLVSEGCLRCGCRFGKYFCPLCRMFDDQLSKGTWHCHGCGICRVGGKEAFTHCDRCRVCYTNKRFEDHTCVEDAMGRDCPVCLEFLHTSTTAVVVPKCGHILHRSCYDEVLTSSTGRCPVCSRTYQRDLKRIQNLDAMIEAEPMPEGLRDQWVQVLCNDCQQKSWVGYHVLGHKCYFCGDYNTVQSVGPVDAVPPGALEEMEAARVRQEESRPDLDHLDSADNLNRQSSQDRAAARLSAVANSAGNQMLQRQDEVRGSVSGAGTAAAAAATAAGLQPGSSADDPNNTNTVVASASTSMEDTDVDETHIPRQRLESSVDAQVAELGDMLAQLRNTSAS